MIEHPLRDAPPDPPMQECEDCGGWLEYAEDGDEDGRYLVFWCEECEAEESA